MSEEVMLASLKGAVAGSSGAVLWLCLRAWLERRMGARRAASARALKERLGR